MCLGWVPSSKVSEWVGRLEVGTREMMAQVSCALVGLIIGLRQISTRVVHLHLYQCMCTPPISLPTSPPLPSLSLNLSFCHYIQTSSPPQQGATKSELKNYYMKLWMGTPEAQLLVSRMEVVIKVTPLLNMSKMRSC